MTIESIIRLSANPQGFADTPDKLEADNFTSQLPIQHSLDYVCDDELGIYVGVWDTTTMKEAPGAYEFEEFMVVLEGKAEIKNNATGLIDIVESGQAFVIPRAYDCQWLQNGYLKKFYFIVDNQSLCANNRNVQGISQFISTMPSVADYQNSQQTFTAGIVNSSAKLMSANNHAMQFIYINNGELKLIDNIGAQATFTQHEALFVPKGSSINWHASNDFNGYFVQLTP